MKSEKMAAILLHLSYNMWTDVSESEYAYSETYMGKRMKVDKKTWDEVLEYAVECGFHAVVIDLGDGIKYQSHPEISLPDAWSVEALKQELAKIRSLGMEPIPKLNFSTGHDAWLKEYHRMVSTDIYYKVCRDLIGEVIDIFENPKYFHLGLDEERAEEQNENGSEFICYRRGKLMWDDIAFYLKCVQDKGVTPWIWADHFWYHPEQFVEHIPKNVVLSPWYYDNIYGGDVPKNEPFREVMRASIKKLSDLGYTQIPCGGNVWRATATNHLLRFVNEETGGRGIAGYLAASWYPTTAEYSMSIKECLYLTKVALEKQGLS